MYKIEFVENKQEDKQIGIPKLPFMIMTSVGNYYMVSRLYNKNKDTNKYLLTNTDGESFDYDYTNEFLLEKINDGTWILMKSKLEIIQ